MKKFLSFLILSISMTAYLSAAVLITEISDPQNSTDAGRYVELYNNGSSDVDLSGWVIQRWTNGNVDPSAPVSLTGSISVGGFYIVCNDAVKFSTTFEGFSCDQDIGTGGPADSNGDDNIALLDGSGATADMFGVAGEDGTGTWHEFEDGRVERNLDSICGCTDLSGCPDYWTVDNDSGGGDGNLYAPEGFDPASWIGEGGDTCAVTDVYGCMDIFALNFNSSATIDNGLCEYADHQVEAGSMYFSPADLVIEMGENVQWNNVGGFHDVVVTDGPEIFGFDAVDGPALIGSYTFSLPGVYEYICSVYGHAGMGMVGTVTVNGAPEPENLFFSEYAEGSSNNKYLEIYNATDGDVDLSGYSLSSCSNGCDAEGVWDYVDNVTFDASVTSGDVHVVCHGSADAFIATECDQTFTYLSNGDDVFALTQVGTGIVLDIIGLVGDDPGEGWEVDGVIDATKNHTLVRKASVTAGNALWLDNVDGDAIECGSSGSELCDSEWIVLDEDTWTFLGSHPHDFIYGCMDMEAENYNADANLDDNSCVYGGTACELGDVYITEAASAGDPVDFIEIYNSGSGDCLLAGFMIDDSDELTDLTFGAVTITAGGYWLGYEDAEGSFSSGLNQDGETIYFSDGVTTITVEMGDAVDVDGIELSQSYDADGNGCYTSPTPGADNADCFVFTYGCTDETATNYNSDANWDDDTCEYEELGEAANLFFSEAAEGSSNNKYLEIYNASDEAIALSAYAFASVSNAPGEIGTYEYWNSFSEGAVVESGDVYVICHGSSDEAILAECDQTHTYLSNGDDGYCLVFGSDGNFEILDCIGDWEADPGDGWDVAGVSAATKDHTIVRKSSVIEGAGYDWASSAGTNSDDSEWVVLDQNDWTYLGSHPHDFGSLCDDDTACNYEGEGDCVYAEENYDCNGNCTVNTDCLGECGGDAVEDECGLCDGDGSSCACTPGDVNGDDTLDILDVVSVVGGILEGALGDSCADMNGDTNIDVLDVVAMVNIILVGRLTDDATSAQINVNNGLVTLDSDGFIGAVQMTISHEIDFAIELTSKAMVADYRTDGNYTTLMIVTPDSDELFTVDGDFSIEEVIVANSSHLVDVVMPSDLTLAKAYPNPFNPSTSLGVYIPSDGFVSVNVYNIMGQLVDVLHNGNMSAGTHSMVWDASNMTSGVYFVRAESLGSVSTQKVMLMK